MAANFEDLKKSLKNIAFDQNHNFFSGNVIALRIDSDEKIEIPLISRVFGPYCKLRTEFFPIDLWPKREASGP